MVLAVLWGIEASAGEIGPSKIYDQLSSLTDRQLLDKGYAFLCHERMDSALICYTMVVNRYYDESSSDQSADHATVAMENLGNIYMTRFFDYRKAYEYLIQAQRLAEHSGSHHHLAYIYLSLCNVWKMSMLTSGKQHDRYVATLRKAFHSAWLSGDADIAATSLVALCDEAVHTSSALDVSTEVKQYLKMKKPRGAQLVRYTERFATATLHAQAHRYTEAAKAFGESASMVDTDVAPERYLYISRCDQAYMLFQSGQRAEAIADLEALLAEARHKRHSDYVMNIAHQLCEMYAEIGQSDLADKYRLTYLAQKDSLISGGNLSEISDVETSAKLSETNREMASLAHRHHAQTIVFIFLAIIAVLLLIAIAIVLHAYHRLRLSNRMLYLKNEELLHQNDKGEKYKQSRLDDDGKHLLLQKITEVLENNTEIYDSGFCLKRMAELVGASYKEVSQVVNEKNEGNFNSMLNEYRIREAQRRLSDTAHYGRLTIEAIAQSVGFKSRTGFTTLFKRYTGMTPSAYQKLAAESKKV